MTQRDCIQNFKVGDELRPLHKKAYQRLLDEFEFDADSMHTEELSKKLGYPGPLMSAYVFTGYLSELMMNTFGESWFDTGEFEMSFVGKGVQQGDQVTLRALVTAVEPEASGVRLSLDFWVEKQENLRPVIGRASAVYTTTASR